MSVPNKGSHWTYRNLSKCSISFSVNRLLPLKETGVVSYRSARDRLSRHHHNHSRHIIIISPFSWSCSAHSGKYTASWAMRIGIWLADLKRHRPTMIRSHSCSRCLNTIFSTTASVQSRSYGMGWDAELVQISHNVYSIDNRQPCNCFYCIHAVTDATARFHC